MGEHLSFKIRFLFIIQIGMPPVSPSGGRIKEGGPYFGYKVQSIKFLKVEIKK
jgi:hypothetical protein